MGYFKPTPSGHLVLVIPWPYRAASTLAKLVFLTMFSHIVTHEVLIPMYETRTWSWAGVYFVVSTALLIVLFAFDLVSSKTVEIDPHHRTLLVRHRVLWMRSIRRCRYSDISHIRARWRRGGRRIRLVTHDGATISINPYTHRVFEKVVNELSTLTGLPVANPGR